MGPFGCLFALVAQLIHMLILLIALPILLIGWLIKTLFGGKE